MPLPLQFSCLRVWLSCLTLERGRSKTRVTGRHSTPACFHNSSIVLLLVPRALGPSLVNSYLCLLHLLSMGILFRMIELVYFTCPYCRRKSCRCMNLLVLPMYVESFAHYLNKPSNVSLTLTVFSHLSLYKFLL